MTTVIGRLVLDEEVTPGTITIEGGLIASVESSGPGAGGADGPYIVPGFVDVHVHGGGGHDAMGGRAALDGMARHLLRHGVTSFLPTGVSAPLDDLYRFVDDVRDWMPVAPADGAEPLGIEPGRAVAVVRSQGRPRPRAPAQPGGPASRRPGSPSRRPPAGDGRAGIAGGPGPDRLAARPGSGDLDGPLGVHARGGARRLCGGRELDHPPVQRDERRGSPVAGSRRGGPDRRRRLRRADRRRRPRRPCRLAAHHPHETGGPPDARQRRDPARGDGRRAGDGRWPRGRGRRSARHTGRDVDAGRVGDRAR